MAYKTMENDRKLEMESDEVMDINCDLCKEQGAHNIQVEGFCLDCEQYFCSTCLRYHQKFLQTHKQQDKNDMPKDLCNDICNEHKELIKFYCGTCNAFVCLKCKTDNHNNCTKVQFLPLLVQNIENNEEFKDFERRLTKFETALNATKVSIDKNLLIKSTNIENYKRQAINALKCQRQEILQNFETAIKRFERTIEDTYNTDKAKHVCVSETVNSVTNKFIMLKNDISNHKRSQQRCKLFMKMKKALPIINNLARKLANARDDSAFTVTVYKYKPEVSILKDISVGVMEINGEVISDNCEKTVNLQHKGKVTEQNTMAGQTLSQYLEQKSREVEQKSIDNGKKSREIEQSFKNLQQKMREAEQKSTETEQKLQETGIRLRNAEQKSKLADQKKRDAEQKSILADQKKRDAELKSILADQKLREAEQKSILADQKLRETEQKCREAEQKSIEAEQKLQEIEHNLNISERQVNLKSSSEVGETKNGTQSVDTIQNSTVTEGKLIEAKQNSFYAKQTSRKYEIRLRNAEKKSREAEHKSRDAEQKSREAEKKTREAEERFKKAKQQSKEAGNKSREADQKFEKAEKKLIEAERARRFFIFATGIISCVMYFLYIFDLRSILFQ